jgi:hypothetical protein
VKLISLIALFTIILGPLAQASTFYKEVCNYDASWITEHLSKNSPLLRKGNRSEFFPPVKEKEIIKTADLFTKKGLAKADKWSDESNIESIFLKYDKPDSLALKPFLNSCYAHGLAGYYDSADGCYHFITGDATAKMTEEKFTKLDVLYLDKMFQIYFIRRNASGLMDEWKKLSEYFKKI